MSTVVVLAPTVSDDRGHKPAAPPTPTRAGTAPVTAAPRTSSADTAQGVIEEILAQADSREKFIPVTRAGFMDVYSNHTFQPAALVRRGDLAYAAGQILSVIALENPRLGASWRSARRKFPDIPPGHLRYRAASMAVEAGVMRTLENDAFQLSRPVTGAEAVAAVQRLADLAAQRR